MGPACALRRFLLSEPAVALDRPTTEEVPVQFAESKSSRRRRRLPSG